VFSWLQKFTSAYFPILFVVKGRVAPNGNLALMGALRKFKIIMGFGNVRKI
jgi:hypothetical protein